MSVTDKLKELIQRKLKIETGGGESAVQLVHKKGQLSARERIDTLLDDASFVEIGALIKPRVTNYNLSEVDAAADGVITGYGTINGTLVYVYGQDSTVLSGSLGEMHAKKICAIYDLALKTRSPIIGLIDSAGLRLQEATDGLHGFGELFLKQAQASGCVPQITAILGNCGGGAALIPATSDFTFMTTSNAKLFINSLNALEPQSLFTQDIGSSKFHSQESGLVDGVYDDDAEVLIKIRELITLIPINYQEDISFKETTDDLNRVSLELNEFDVTTSDIRLLVNTISDSNYFYEIKPEYGKEIVTGFMRLGGATIGVVANQGVQGSNLSSKSAEKIGGFVHFCDAFSIPVLTITSITGFTANAKEEVYLPKALARMVYAFTNATVPKVNLVVGNSFGSGYLMLNSKHIGADISLAWPSAKIGIMDAESAVRIIYADEINASNAGATLIQTKKQEYEANQSSPYKAAERGYVDDVIEPAATRKRLIAVFEMLHSKIENGPAKKHGSIL